MEIQESMEERLILVLEDNPDHARLIVEVLGGGSVDHRIVTIADGPQAMDFLHQQGDYAGFPRPDLIILDLNLSGKQGQNVLAEVKTNPRLKRIPIIVLSLSAEKADIFKTYSLQGNCYVIKPSDLEQLAQIVQRIQEFWLGIVTLPVE